ncbi:MAG: HEAT repeat domain-containing protein [Bacteroidetes bacterium]|nr:HEAT repeat domain-containing protein [Bacteroidota bacterium]MBU1680153.1 HEAT repeat domain-containing protein [Bacteroidota bacterium]MBU2507455.1 HEAT repeat domain-containing protein [Bacteroidota bacterium]
MKKVIVLFVVFASVASLVYAGNSPASTKVSYERIEATLLHGLKSANKGLSISSSQILGSIKSSKAVIPLMHILRESEVEASRIAAALSLYKIGDSRGINALRQSAKFDSSERVRNMCANFYNEFKSN